MNKLHLHVETVEGEKYFSADHCPECSYFSAPTWTAERREIDRTTPLYEAIMRDAYPNDLGNFRSCIFHLNKEST